MPSSDRSQHVLVVTSDVPFVHGGHRVIARELAAAIEGCGHRVEIVHTPSNRFGRSLQAYLATRLTDVEQTGYGAPVNRVISLRYPAYAIRHPHHTAWVVHRMREYYNLWEHLCEHLTWRARLKEEVRREVIHRLDHWLLTDNVEKVYCISDTVRRRLDRWGDIAATTLHPPAPARPYRTDAYEPIVFAVSRLHRWKRLHLLVEALAHAPRARAAIAGEGPEREALEARARELGVDGRVSFLGPLDEASLIEWYARAAVVYFAPLNEDYGFVTAEAFSSRKPVITCDDSGGPLDLVRDGINGRVTAPKPAAIAVAIEELLDDGRRAEKLGEAGYEVASALSWERTARTLLGESA